MSVPVANLTPLDVALGQGSPAELAAARARMDVDPLALLAVAEDVAFVQELRALRVEAGPIYGVALNDLCRRAAERVQRPVSRWRGWPWGLAAAAAAAVALWWLDPLAPRRAPAAAPIADFVLQPRPPASDDVVPPEVVADARAVAWQADLDAIRRRLDHEASPHLREALEAGVAEAPDRLRGWLDPRNALALQRLDHELRANAEYRREELRRRGGMPAADVRVQQLADELARALLAGDGGELVDDAYAVRAVVGAGPAGAERAAAVVAAGERIVAALPAAHGERLVAGLAALCDAAVVDTRFADAVRSHGARLVDGLLRIDGDNWSRRLPALLAPSAPAAAVAEAARTAGRLPAFGLDASRCQLARGLLVGALRDRRALGQDRPDLVAGLLYGGADLLPATEREQLQRDLRRWRPARLAPDFRLCQLFAWSIEPGARGHARLQSDLRELAVLPAPAGGAELGAFVLCLATAYAAPQAELADGAASRRGGS